MNDLRMNVLVGEGFIVEWSSKFGFSTNHINLTKEQVMKCDGNLFMELIDKFLKEKYG